MSGSGKKVMVLDSGGLPAEYAAMESSADTPVQGDLVALGVGAVIDSSLLPGVGPDSTTAQATEAISAGDLVQVYDVSGTKSVRKADSSAASRGKECNGFAPAAISNGATGTIYLSGVMTGLTGLTPEAKYFLGTAGAKSTTPDATSGHITQEIGWADGTTKLVFRPKQSILRV